VATTALVSADWWARYIPQLWLLPILIILIILCNRPPASRSLNALCVILGMMALVDTSLACIPNWSSNFNNTRIFHAELDAARRDCKRSSQSVAIYSPVTPLLCSIRNRLNDNGIPYRTGNEKPKAGDRCYRIVDGVGVVFIPSTSDRSK
jgi:hypothetical protein